MHTNGTVLQQVAFSCIENTTVQGKCYFPPKSLKGARADTWTTLEICPPPAPNARRDEIIPFRGAPHSEYTKQINSLLYPGVKYLVPGSLILTHCWLRRWGQTKGLVRGQLSSWFAHRHRPCPWSQPMTAAAEFVKNNILGGLCFKTS